MQVRIEKKTFKNADYYPFLFEYAGRFPLNGLACYHCRNACHAVPSYHSVRASSAVEIQLGKDEVCFWMSMDSLIACGRPRPISFHSQCNRDQVVQRLTKHLLLIPVEAA